MNVGLSLGKKVLICISPGTVHTQDTQVLGFVYHLPPFSLSPILASHSKNTVIKVRGRMFRIYSHRVHMGTTPQSVSQEFYCHFHDGQGHSCYWRTGQAIVDLRPWLGLSPKSAREELTLTLFSLLSSRLADLQPLCEGLYIPNTFSYR